MNKYTTITWNLDENDRMKFRGGTHRKVLRGPSDRNNCWNINIEIDKYQGKYGRNGEKIYWMINKLNQWPQNIGRLDVEYKITCDYKSGHQSMSHWYRREVGLLQKGYNPLPKQLYGYLSVTLGLPSCIKVEFNVVTVYDKGGNIINEDEWKEYGIVENRHFLIV